MFRFCVAQLPSPVYWLAVPCCDGVKWDCFPKGNGKQNRTSWTEHSDVIPFLLIRAGFLVISKC